MTNPIRAELEALIAACDEHGGMWPDHHVKALFDAAERARAVLAAEPTFIAGEPSDEDLADLVEVFNGDPLPAMRRALELWGRPTVATLAAEPPAPAPATDGERGHVPDAGNMVAAAYAARLRQCPTHGQLPANAWACPECLRELREELAKLKAPAADVGEREAYAQWLDGRGAMADLGVRNSYFRAAALLRQPAPVPADLTPVAYDAKAGTRIELTRSTPRPLWAVRSGAYRMSIHGEWSVEPMPSSRTADYLAMHSFPSPAAAWAELQRYRKAAASFDGPQPPQGGEVGQ